MDARRISDIGDEAQPELVRLRNAVACELHAQLAMRGETIRLADVCGVADAVAVRLDREFRIEGAPSPQGDLQDDDSLGLDSAAFYGSVMPTENDPGPSERYPIFDYTWPYRS
jgi:hypothetical protein